MNINLPDVLAEVTAIFSRYEDALVTNKADVLDELFWPSESTVRYGAAENLVGINAIRACRLSRPSVGLQRQLTRTVITTYGRDFATAMTEFQREGSTRSGRQSQTWARLLEGWRAVVARGGAWWRVVAAHVSVVDLQG